MKNNTNTIKNSLEKALQNFPEDFSLIIVKNYIYIQMALYKLNEVELKRNKRELKHQKRKENKKIGTQQVSMQAIEKMIDEEKEKIERQK